jgi:alpha-D-ribose 1-methylphosphonate 5-triphosphate synthase subunit PhnG
MVRTDHDCRILGVCKFETNDRRYAWLSDIKDVEMQLRRSEEDTSARIIAKFKVAAERP